MMGKFFGNNVRVDTTFHLCTFLTLFKFGAADVVKVVPPHWTQFGADPCWQAI